MNTQEREPDWDAAAAVLDDELFEKSQTPWSDIAEGDFEMELSFAEEVRAGRLTVGEKVEWPDAGPVDLKDPYNRKKRGLKDE